MRRLFLTLLGLGVLIVLPAPALAQVKVFVCEPEWKALADEIGGDKLEAYSATTASQDPHHVRAKPSLIAKMRNADLVICSGADLEVGWLPLLLEKAGNVSTQSGKVGYLMAAEYVDILDKPAVVDRSMGDVHPDGNPHVHLNPHNILKVATELETRLAKIDAENAAYYKSRLDAFAVKWNAAIIKWELDAAGLKGKNVIVHHKDLTYLLNWLKLSEAATLEEKPGIAPSSGYLEKVLQNAKAIDLLAIMITPHTSTDAAEWLSAKTKTPTVVLPYTVGGNEKATDLFSLFDETIRMLNNAK